MSNTRTTQELVDKFLAGHAGEQLIAKHNLESTGVWLVRGEGDENGYNATAIGYFSGKLDDVLRMAVHHKHWSSWGRGGEILPINVQDIAMFSEHKERLRKDRDALLAQAAALEAEINK